MQSNNMTLSLELVLQTASHDTALLARLTRSQGHEEKTALAKIMAVVGAAEPDVATDTVLDILENYGRTIATFAAEQDMGEFEIRIEGFSKLCVVTAPEYGTTGPFASHDDAESYVRWNWRSFIKGESWAKVGAASPVEPKPLASTSGASGETTSSATKPIKRGSPEYMAWLATEVESLNSELGTSTYMEKEMEQLRTQPLQATFVTAQRRANRSDSTRPAFAFGTQCGSISPVSPSCVT